MHVVSVMNYKGGVGKTTLTANLGAEIANRGHKVLLLDLDPQANLTFSFYSVDEWQSELRKERTIKRWYDGEMPGRNVPLAKLVVTPPRVNEFVQGSGGQLDLISSHLGLIDIDLLLAARLGGGTTLAESKRKYIQLHSCLADGLSDPAFREYDLVLIDCAPNFGLVTKTAIVASNHVLMPAKADYLSTLGIDYLAGSCDKLVAEYNDYIDYNGADNGGRQKISPRFLGVVFTMIQTYAGRPIVTQQNHIEQVRLNSEVPILNGVLRNSPRHFGDAGASGIPAMVRAPMDDDVAVDFRRLTNEFVKAFTGHKDTA
ncbi:ParA family protein [Planosporangium flavigriseum]|uniref:Cobyrinic acid a,c-diamide synthase n=1 Tax=Planosporangium flavigriseum TaxID=373681 RepID=A0A8J3LVC7_9ACTN|nr:ParA family protein [Planosporangium flavigriseum]GIG73945.1 cobyrinic acid a,c-diamide synthase [Planosporangium flavigriseum]